VTRAAIALVCALLAVRSLAQDPGVDIARQHLAGARYGAAAEAARARLARDEGDAGAWQALADAHAARGRSAAAVAAYREALARGTERPLQATVALARLHALAGEAGQANALWTDVMQRWRAGGVDDARELMAVAAAARALGRGDPALRRTALRIYEEAMDRAAEDPAPRVALGELLLASYNNQEALPLFEQALALDDADVDALLGLARSHYFDDSGSARDAARAALKVAPGHVQTRVFLARLLLDEEDLAGTERELEAALEVNPRSPEALSLLAGLRDRQGDEEAVNALMALVGLVAPRAAGPWVSLSEIAADRRRYADAVRYAERAVRLDPESWRAHALLGMNRLRLGQMRAARASLETAFRGDPFNVWTKNTLDLLDAMDGYAQIARGRFVLIARADHAAALAPYLFPLAEQAYDAHVARYGVTPARPVRIEVHPEHDDLSVRTLGLVGVDLLGVSFGPTVVLDAPMANPGGPFNWASVLWHELAHTFQLDLSLGRAPRWLAEGMAVRDEQLARDGWGADVGPGFLQAYLEGKLASASTLNRSFLEPDGPEALGHAYVQAGLLVEMIEREHGGEALRALLEGYRDGGATEDLVQSLLGMTPAAFDRRFDAFMTERFGTALEALRSPGEEGAKSRYATLLRGAREALERGELEAAERGLLEARALVPGHVGPHSAHHALVALYRKRGDRPATARALATQVAVDADDLDALLALADELQALEDAQGAADALAKAMLIQPFDGALHARLAGLYEIRGEWAAAARERAAVVALGAVDPVDARYRLALASSRSGDPQTARREILAALERAPLFEEGLELLLAVRAQLANPGATNTPSPAAREGEER
jgi:tetratricopeptide (TPR) repeat protein